MRGQPSVMTHSFSKVPRAEIPRSMFNRSHGLKTAFDAGYLVPIFVDEALPGDTFNLRLNVLARMSTPLRPVMDNLFLDSFFFAVPIRLVWNNFLKFNGEQTDPGDSTSFILPTMTAPGGGYAVSSLHDYLGIPPGKVLTHMSLFHRAYNLIWNEWMRDQNLQNSVVVDKDDGPDDPADYVLLRRGKRHDYFTSCLPWPQKGTAVTIPLGTSATVKTSSSDLFTGAQEELRIIRTDGFANAADVFLGASSPNVTIGSNAGFVPLGAGATVYPSNLYADLSEATAATINQLRQSFQIQKLYERDARGGTRYTEIIQSHFGVTSPDARLQRPEYLGGGSTPVSINPVANTAATPGTLGATGVVTSGNGGFTKSFTEHTLIIGLVSVRADLTYQQGLHRMFSRSTRFDFYWPALAQIGEQSVLNKEIWADGSANDDLVFGYQERYAEYRYKPSLITGIFRSDAAGTLDIWHLSQDFATLPALNASFIQEDPPIDRVIATPSEPHFIYDSYIKLICARPMPVYGVPGMIDHF